MMKTTLLNQLEMLYDAPSSARVLLAIIRT